MNSRRSFLSDIFKAGVSAMILPSAVTYAGRVWKKPITSSLYTCWSAEDVAKYERLPFYLAKTQVQFVPYYHIWKNISGFITRPHNMGDLTKPNLNWVDSQG